MQQSSPPLSHPPEEPSAWVREARVARLATSSAEGRPHCVPVCFAWWRGAFWIALDEKPKTVEVRKLRRVRNILENPRATLLVDHYEEDWTALRFAMVEARAELCPLPEDVLAELRLKYPQYQAMALELALRLEPERVVEWPG